MRVTLVPPGLRHEQPFLEAVQRSRTLHGRWVQPPTTSDTFRAYVASVRGRTRTGSFVTRVDTGELVGVITVSEIVRGIFQSAYLGYYGFAPHHGQGLMTEGLALVLDKAFGPMHLHRLEANIQPDNEPSRKLVQRLGFRCEGLSRRYLRIAGRWRDHERWAVLAEEWRAFEGRPTRRRGSG